MVMTEQKAKKVKAADNPHAKHRLRVRTRFARENGFDSFAEHEVLEFLLYHTIPRIDTNPTAHDLLDYYGTLANVLEAPIEELQKNGLTFNSAVLLHAIPSLARYYEQSRYREKVPLYDTDSMVAYCRSLFIGHTEELFYLICLNAQNKVNHAALVSRGTLTEVPVYPRKAVDLALRYQAVNVILAHNHPGFGTAPSHSDMSITRQLRDVLNGISVHVLDHIIICGNRYFSYAEKDLLF